MDKTILEKYVSEGLTQRAIASLVGKSQATVKYWLKKHDLQTAQSNKYDGSGYKLSGYCCKRCGDIDKNNSVNTGEGRKSRSCCKSCHAKYTIDRFRRYKRQAIDYKGGKCVRCGYDKCIGSLVFHHRNSDEKDPNWRRMRNWKFDRVKLELDKCDLLCSNCHGEIHWG